MASEAAPYAKTGGLADVIGALPFALADQGDEVAVVMPLYASAAAKLTSADRVRDRLPIWISTSLSYQVSIRLLTIAAYGFTSLIALLCSTGRVSTARMVRTTRITTSGSPCCAAVRFL